VPTAQGREQFGSFTRSKQADPLGVSRSSSAYIDMIHDSIWRGHSVRQNNWRTGKPEKETEELNCETIHSVRSPLLKMTD
jgi:hypothetical protein